MANIHRALVAAGEGLGMFAGRQIDKENERVMAMRQENFLRLQNQLGEESRAKDRAQQQEQFQAQLSQVREEGQADRALRREEGAAERTLRSTEGAADRSLQRDRWSHEDRQLMERDYLARITQIDNRLQELNDYKVQAQAEGKIVDASYLQQLDGELAQLQDQKRLMAQERDVMLMRSGDSRYRKLTPEQVAELKRSAAPAPATPGVAAQAPEKPQGGGTSIKIPPPPKAPEKPPGMVLREQRAAGRRSTAEERMQRRAIAGEAGEGIREAAGAARAIVGSLQSRQQEGPEVGAIRRAMQSGGKPSAEQMQFLRSIDRQRLVGVYGFSEADLARLGL